MRLLKIISLLLLFAGCLASASCDFSDNNRQMYQKEFAKKKGRDWVVITLEGCEYIYFPDGNASWGTHKGNCSNPVHSNKKY